MLFPGLRQERSALVLVSNPRVWMDYGSAGIEAIPSVTYRVEGTGCGSLSVRLSSADLHFARRKSLPHRCRQNYGNGQRLTDGMNRLSISSLAFKQMLMWEAN
jgi:hypothetical protein